MRSARSRAKALVERALGVKVLKAGDPALSKHFYPHLHRLRPWSPQDVVFDVGANDGRTVLALQGVLPSSRIYAFEPVSSTFQTLAQRTGHLAHVRCFHLALGSKSGRDVMYLTEESVTNSFSPDWANTVGTEEVEVSTVDRVMEEQGVDFVHFLKVDTEGHELEVLRGAEGALASSRIAAIQAEVRFDKPGGGIEPLQNFLAPFDYHLYGIYNQCHSRAQPPSEWPAARTAGYAPKALAYCDAVFVASRV